LRQEIGQRRLDVIADRGSVAVIFIGFPLQLIERIRFPSLDVAPGGLLFANRESGSWTAEAIDR
jgi:hypothetical protein